MKAPRQPRFLYFDLGNVLLYFDHAIACRQMAAVASTADRVITPQQVREVVFETSLEAEFESGRVSPDEFYDRFCDAIKARPDRKALERAANDIFWPNLSIKPLLGALFAARVKVGILSNTNIWHWEYVADGRYGPIPAAFDRLALSFELGVMKPELAIYHRAADLAGYAPHEIFYVDDVPDNVVAAREAGFDAVQYTTTHDLALELRKRKVGMNY